MTTEIDAEEFNKLNLSEREVLIITSIMDYREKNFGLSPTNAELLKILNTKLETPLSSVLQINREVTKLRLKDLLINPENDPRFRGMHRNLIPTDKGRAAAQKIKEDQSSQKNKNKKNK